MDTATQKATTLLTRLARLMAQDGHDRGLRPVQWETLRYLAAANRFSRTPSALTQYLGSTKGTVSQTLKALEGKGWIEKQRATEDKRSVDLSLTSAGRRLLAADPQARLAHEIATLTEDQRTTLAATLDAIVRGRLAAVGGRPFGLCRRCRHFQRDHVEGTPHRCRLLDVPLTREDSEAICHEQEEASK